MIVETPMIDWVTITTRNWEAAKAVSSTIRRELQVDGSAAKPKSIMQYHGKVWGDKSLFTGEGEQDGQPHYMIRVSGENAHYAMMALQRNSSRVMVEHLNFTRIDIQMTLESVTQQGLVTSSAYRAAANAIKEKGEDVKMASRTCVLYDNFEGNCTLYAGSRKSDRLVRTYQKEDESGKWYTRVEVELKGKLAGPAATAILAGGKAADDVLKGVLVRFVKGTGKLGLYAKFRQVTAGWKEGENLGGGRWVRGEDSTLRWLVNAVTPAVKKLANNHEQRDLAYVIVREMLDLFEVSDVELHD